MEKKPNGKRTKSFDHLIEKIFRFKLPKRSSRSTMDTRHSIEYKPAEASQQRDDDYYDYQYDWQYRKISPDDLRPFCDQLGKFLKYVQNIQDLVYLTYDYPSLLQNQLEKAAKELECLFLEVKDAVNSIDRLKLQKKAVRKEKSSVKKTLRKLREDEVREMEGIISLYDKAMFMRWETVKNTHKPEVLEILLNDVKGKQQALEHLNTLVTRKLGQLQLFMPIGSNAENGMVGTANATNNNGKEKASGSDSAPAGSSNVRDEDKQGGPGSMAIRRHHPHGQGANTTRNSPFRRRRHHDRQESHVNGRYISTPVHESSGIDLPLVPFTLANTPFQILGPILADGANSNHSLLAASSNSNTANTIRNNENISPTANGNNGVGSEFQSEMRTVLQALFGELRQATPATITINNNIEPTENSTNSNREIELYTLRRPT